MDKLTVEYNKWFGMLPLKFQNFFLKQVAIVKSLWSMGSSWIINAENYIVGLQTQNNDSLSIISNKQIMLGSQKLHNIFMYLSAVRK